MFLSQFDLICPEVKVNLLKFYINWLQMFDYLAIIYICTAEISYINYVNFTFLTYTLLQGN